MISSNPAVRSRCRTGGFTLVEIVLVIAIGVVFFGGAAVLLTSTGGDKDLIAARKQLEASARSSREAALREGRKKVVVLNDTGVGGAAFSGGVEMDVITPRISPWGGGAGAGPRITSGRSPAEDWWNPSGSVCAGVPMWSSFPLAL